MTVRALRAAATATALLIASPSLAQSVDDAAPLPPAGASPTFVPPPHDDAGYKTPNRALTPEETVWHVRVALNVAALGCRGAGEAETVAAYNAVLKAEAPVLASAMAATENGFKARHGDAWQARYDDDMTRLYNFFAQPPAQSGFCSTAQAVLRESAAVAPADFPAFAAGALQRLEAPFTTFFAAYDAYRTSLATWQARRASVVIATASAPSVGLAVVPTRVAVVQAEVAAVAAPSAEPPAEAPAATPVAIASVRMFGPQP
jgi:hypothetical protein